MSAGRVEAVLEPGRRDTGARQLGVVGDARVGLVAHAAPQGASRSEQLGGGAVGRALDPAHGKGRERASKPVGAEILAALANGVTLVALSIWIFIEASRLFSDPQEVLGSWMLAVAAVGLLVNVGAAGILARGRTNSLNVQAAFRYVLADLLGSVCTIVAAVVILATGWQRVDPTVSVVIGLLVLTSLRTILRDATRILIGASPDGIDPGEVGQTMSGHPGVRNVHDLHVWTITSGFPALSAHVLFGPREDCHQRRAELEAMLHDEFGIDHTSLQVDHSQPKRIELSRKASRDPASAG